MGDSEFRRLFPFRTPRSPTPRCRFRFPHSAFRIPHSKSAGLHLQPVHLLAVTAQAKVLEKRIECELGRAFVAWPVVDSNFQLSLEIDQPGADPHIESIDPAHLEVDQVALAAALHLEGCGAEVLAEHLDGLWSR